MNDKIEIINFLQDRNFKDRYHQETPEIENNPKFGQMLKNAFDNLENK